MPEVQSHGFDFERWVRLFFFGDYKGNYMQKWDVQPAHNMQRNVPECFHNVPVSIKTAKYGSPIGLGDALRQRQIDHDFLMIVGFWEQRTKAEKWIVDIGYALFRANHWQTLWGQLTLAEIEEIDRMVKNKSNHYSTVRKLAQEWKRRASVATSKIVINPKIDSKDQRRIQSSLPFRTFWEQAANNPQSRADQLWSQTFPNPIKSSPRTFH